MKNISLYILLIIMVIFNPPFTESKYHRILHSKFKNNTFRFNYSVSDMVLFKTSGTKTSKEILN